MRFIPLSRIVKGTWRSVVLDDSALYIDDISAIWRRLIQQICPVKGEVK